MNKKEAYGAILNGCKMTTRGFNDEKYVTHDGNSIVDESGYNMGSNFGEFWERMPNDGWSMWNPKDQQYCLHQGIIKYFNEWGPKKCEISVNKTKLLLVPTSEIETYGSLESVKAYSRKDNLRLRAVRSIKPLL